MSQRNPKFKFAVCINNADYPVSLEVHKIYRVMPDEDAAIEGDMRVIDESGEDYLYPAEYFVFVELPREVERSLLRAAWYSTIALEGKVMIRLKRCTLMLIASCSILSSLALVSARNNFQEPKAETSRPSPNEVLRSAQTIFIRSNSVYFKPSTLENSLLQQEEFQQWGLVITREEGDADLIIEVGRKVFTTSFIYSVLDPRNKRVIASGRVNSIGGTVEGKITSSFMKKLRVARQTPVVNPVKQPR
jgi:hypothetical protein